MALMHPEYVALQQEADRLRAEVERLRAAERGYLVDFRKLQEDLISYKQKLDGANLQVESLAKLLLRNVREQGCPDSPMNEFECAPGKCAVCDAYRVVGNGIEPKVHTKATCICTPADGKGTFAVNPCCPQHAG